MWDLGTKDVMYALIIQIFTDGCFFLIYLEFYTELCGLVATY